MLSDPATFDHALQAAAAVYHVGRAGEGEDGEGEAEVSLLDDEVREERGGRDAAEAEQVGHSQHPLALQLLLRRWWRGGQRAFG